MDGKATLEAAEAFEDAFASVRRTADHVNLYPPWHSALIPQSEEHTWERCRSWHWFTPRCPCKQQCGYLLARVTTKPLPTPDFSEQAALAQLKTKDALLLRAAKTLDYNADILLAAGKRTEAGQTKQAATAIREAIGEEG